jgi:hypothetical protein
VTDTVWKDAPYLFIGADDSVDTLCVPQSSLVLQNCTVIRSSGLVVYDGDKRKCDEAHLTWGFIILFINFGLFIRL